MISYHIIIWGAGNTAREALKYVRDTVEIIGFLDNNPEIKEFEGLKALELKKLGEYEYDFIVICSIHHAEIYKQLTGMAVDESKILINPIPKAQSFLLYQSKRFETKWDALLRRDRKPEIFISGISYHDCGIDEQVFTGKAHKEAFNFAIGSQDIFYDFQIAKLLARNGYLENVTHYIVGLCYYSFEYDMSKSVNGWEIIRYYPFIKEQHNLASAAPFEDFIKQTKNYMEKNVIYYSLFHGECNYIINDEEGQKAAKVDFNKNHPVTVWENKAILKQFLAFLREKRIKPVIVIMPAVKGYVDGIPKGFKERFYGALAECIENELILDYLGKYYGDVSDYYHVSHFNECGARQFTERLIQDICW